MKAKTIWGFFETIAHPMWQSDRNYSGLITTQGVHTILKC